MKPVERSEILDWMTYSERRDELRAAAMRAKSVRRVMIGDAFTFLFENRETVRYQVHEMLRAPGPRYSMILLVPPVTVRIPSTFRITSLGAVQPRSAPVSRTAIVCVAPSTTVHLPPPAGPPGPVLARPSPRPPSPTGTASPAPTGR